MIHQDGQILIEIMGGPVGPEGPPNAGVALLGVAGPAWPPSSAPAKGDLWVIPEPPPAGAPAWATNGHGAFWDGHNWVDAGLLRGPIGLRGEPGPPLNVKGVATMWPPAAHPQPGDIWQLVDAPMIGLPPEFKQGGAAAWDDITKKWVPLDAIRGPAGHSITVYGPSPTPPATALVERGDIWLATDPTLFSSTFDPSTIVQMPGPPGPVGPVGLSAFDSWRQSTGRLAAPVDDFLASITGPAGALGAKGAAGETFKIEGVVATPAALPATPPRLTVYLISTTGELYIYDTASAAALPSGYVNLGKIAGPAGRAAWLSTPVYDTPDIPAVGQQGQMVYVTVTGHLWGWDDVASKWVDGGRVGGGGIADGYDQGQTLTWDDANGKWVPTDWVRMPTGNMEGDLPTWDDAQQEWVPHRPRMGDEDNVNLPTDPADGDGAVPVYTAATDVFDVRRLRVEDLADGPGALGPLAGDILAWDEPQRRWLPTTPPAGTLTELTDVDMTTPPTDGQVPSWNATTSKWEPKSTTSPIVFIGTGTLVAADITDATKNFGMPVDTVPPPASYPPAPGDQYLDLATGMVSAFTGTTTGRPRSGVVTGVNSPASRDLIPERLNDLLDVTIAGLVDKQVLAYDAAAGGWKNVTLAAGPKGDKGDTGVAGPVGPGLIQAMTLSAYNALAVKDPNTLYVTYGT